MSDYRAIAAVTATLKAIALEAAHGVNGESDVRIGPPTAKLAEEAPPIVNIFLFRTTPNAAMRNAHLPTRRNDATISARSETALNLHYMFTFYGDSAQYEPERLLGAVAIALESRPLLTSKLVTSALSGLENDVPDVAKADLPDASSTVTVTPDMLSLDELSKIWSIFFQVPYALSTAYVCSHVVIESDERPGAALPVARTDILAGPIAGFSLRSAGPDERGAGPVVWGGPLHLAGEGLGRHGTSLRIDGDEIALSPEHLSPSAIRLTLAQPLLPQQLRAGLHVAQAVAPAGSPATPPHLRRPSNAVSFALHPSIAVAGEADDGADPASGTITVAFSPEVGRGQAVTLTLDSRSAGPFGILLDPQPLAPGPDTFAQLTFSFAGLPAGTYLVRAHVDGLSSVPMTETDPNSPKFGELVGPTVEIG